MYENIFTYSVIAFTVYSVAEAMDMPQLSPSMTEEQINPKFYLFTRNNAQNSDLLIKSNTQTITDSHFNGTKDTKFIVHGFLDNQLINQWMYAMKDEYLSAQDVNVIIVDWSGGNGAQGFPDYGLAATNTRIVGQVIADLIIDLQLVSGIVLSSVHILGHSLGAQIAGFAGKALNGQIGRISGLDPAGPNFDGKTPDERLDPTDALFVDAVHTNGNPIIPELDFGTDELCGHLDFFPNGGVFQPGCLDMNRVLGPMPLGMIEVGRSVFACDHDRAYQFYTETINPSNTKAVGYQARDYESFLRGDSTDCGPNGNKCALFGEGAIGWANIKHLTQGYRYYFKTDSETPFLVPEYGVKIKISSNQPTQVNGQLIVTLHGSENDMSFTVNYCELNSGNTYTYIELSKYPLGAITSASLKWQNPLPLISGYLYVDSIQAIPLSSENASNAILHSQEVKTFCSSNPSQGIPAGVKKDFTIGC